MGYTLPDPNRASEMFWDSLRGGASSWITCSCGKDWNPPSSITNFHDNAVDDEDDFEWYRYVELEGKTFVQDCDECCTKLARYEQWIWNNRNDIREYLRIRVNEELKWAEYEKELNILASV